MNRFARTIRPSLALLAALTVVFCLSATAFAAADGASVDFSQTGSVTVTLTDGDGNAVSGGRITIYQVAALYLEDGDMAYVPTDAFQSCTAQLDVTDTSLAAALVQYVQDNGIGGTSAAVDTAGTVRFSGLELGLYLLVQTTASGNYETINPFVVTVPMDSDGAWDYTVDASPKVGTVTTQTTEINTSTTSSDSDLPQTGQLNWPVPVLAVSGLALFAAGWAMVARDRKKRDHAA